MHMVSIGPRNLRDNYHIPKPKLTAQYKRFVSSEALDRVESHSSIRKAAPFPGQEVERARESERRASGRGCCREIGDRNGRSDEILLGRERVVRTFGGDEQGQESWTNSLPEV